MEVYTRDQIDNKFKWKLEDIYKDDKEWELDFNKIPDVASDVCRYTGKLLNNKDNILACLKAGSIVGRLIEKLYVYAKMRLDQDCQNNLYKGMTKRIELLANHISTETAFIIPEISENDEEFLRKLSKDDDFKDYSYNLELIIKDKAHTLSTKEEVIISKVGRFSNLFQDAFTMMDNVDIKFESFKNNDGENVELSHGLYGYILQTGCREDREKAFNSMFNAYKQNINVISTLYMGNIEKDYFYASVRKYKSCLDKATSNENVPMDVYYKLIENVHNNLDVLHKYMAYRKKALGYKELHMYDLHMPITKDIDKKIEYDEAKEIVLKALNPLGEEYQGLLKKAFNEGWIDVLENKNKRSGAYSWGCYDCHPYVLLNYQPMLSEVFTIAHELGHAMHSYYSNKNQPYPKSAYEIFVAEVASTVNETLLVLYLLKDASGEYKKYLLSYLLNMFRTTVFRQAQFAEFEEKAHSIVEDGYPVTPESLSEVYYELNKLYYGDDVISDDLIRYEWARIPHFYTSFYVYKYSTGLISAICIAKDILDKKEPFIEKYKKFLSAGGSMPPCEILKLVDVDLTTSNPYNKAMEFFKNTLDELISME